MTGLELKLARQVSAEKLDKINWNCPLCGHRMLLGDDGEPYCSANCYFSSIPFDAAMAVVQSRPYQTCPVCEFPLKLTSHEVTMCSVNACAFNDLPVGEALALLEAKNKQAEKEIAEEEVEERVRFIEPYLQPKPQWLIARLNDILDSINTYTTAKQIVPPEIRDEYNWICKVIFEVII